MGLVNGNIKTDMNTNAENVRVRVSASSGAEIDMIDPHAHPVASFTVDYSLFPIVNFDASTSHATIRNIKSSCKTDKKGQFSFFTTETGTINITVSNNGVDQVFPFYQEGEVHSLDIVEYHWDFGDAETAMTTDPTVMHDYTGHGDSFSATLIVIDSLRNCSTYSLFFDKNNTQPEVISVSITNPSPYVVGFTPLVGEVLYTTQYEPTSVHYQWQYDNSGWEDIVGATSQVYQYPQLAGDYRLVGTVTNKFGTDSDVSSSVTYVDNVDPIITDVDIIVVSPETEYPLTADVTVSANPYTIYLTYQWQKRIGIDLYEDIDSEVNEEFTPTEQGIYRVCAYAYNGYTSDSACSSPVSIVISGSIPDSPPIANLSLSIDPSELVHYARFCKRNALTDGRSTMSGWQMNSLSAGYSANCYVVHVNKGDNVVASINMQRTSGAGGPGNGADNNASLLMFNDEFILSDDAAYVNIAGTLGRTPDDSVSSLGGNSTSYNHTWDYTALECGTVVFYLTDGWNTAAIRTSINSLTVNGTPIFTTGDGVVTEDLGSGDKPAYEYSTVVSESWRVLADASGSTAGTNPITNYEFDFDGDIYNQSDDDPLYICFDSGGVKECVLTVTDGTLEDSDTQEVNLSPVDPFGTAEDLWSVAFSSTPPDEMTLLRMIPDQTIDGRYGLVFARISSGVNFTHTTGNLSCAFVILDIDQYGSKTLVKACSAVDTGVSSLTGAGYQMWYNAGYFMFALNNSSTSSTIYRFTPTRTTIAAFNPATDFIAAGGHSRTENFTYLGRKGWWDMSHTNTIFGSSSQRHGSNQNSQIVVTQNTSGTLQEINLMAVDQTLGGYNGAGVHTNGPICSKNGTRIFNNRHHNMSEVSNLGGHVSLYIPDVPFEDYDESDYTARFLNPSPYPAGTSGDSDTFGYGLAVDDDGERLICTDENDGLRLISCNGSSFSAVDNITPVDYGYGSPLRTIAGTVNYFLAFNRNSDAHSDYFALNNGITKVGVFQWPNTTPEVEFNYSDYFSGHTPIINEGGIITEFMMDKLVLVEFTDDYISNNVRGRYALIDLPSEL